MMKALAAGTVPAARHHHWQRLTEHCGTIDHGLISCEVRLTRQHVHRLGARGARHQFHRKEIGAAACKRVERGTLAIGLDHRRDDGAFIQRLHIVEDGTPHAKQNVSAVQRLGAADDLGSRGAVCIVREARAQPSPRLDSDFCAEAGKFLHRIWGNGDTRLVRRFTGDSYRDHEHFRLRGAIGEGAECPKRKRQTRLRVCPSLRFRSWPRASRSSNQEDLHRDEQQNQGDDRDLGQTQKACVGLLVRFVIHVRMAIRCIQAHVLFLPRNAHVSAFFVTQVRSGIKSGELGL
jgi:hypothetical protein